MHHHSHHHHNILDHHHKLETHITLGTDSYHQKGWRLTAHKYYDSDKRDDHSSYVFIHKDHKECQTWKLEKEGDHWRISLRDDNYGQKGWHLTAHRYLNKDKRDDHSTNLCLHKEKKEGQLFDITLDHETGLYRIQLATDDYHQKRWSLTAHRHYDHDKRDDDSTFVCLHKDHKDGQLWHIHKV